MNTLEVVVHQTHDLENLITHHEFSCYIDGERVNITFDPVEFVIAKPQENPRSYEIFTCSCGHAGCAGIFEGISVHKEDDKVVWIDGDSKLKQQRYEFDSVRYEETVTNTLQTLFDIAEYRELYGYVEFPDDHSILYFKNVSELNDELDFRLNRGVYSDPYRGKDEDEL